MCNGFTFTFRNVIKIITRYNILTLIYLKKYIHKFVLATQCNDVHYVLIHLSTLATFIDITGIRTFRRGNFCAGYIGATGILIKNFKNTK